MGRRTRSRERKRCSRSSSSSSGRSIGRGARGSSRGYTPSRRSYSRSYSRDRSRSRIHHSGGRRDTRCRRERKHDSQESRLTIMSRLRALESRSFNSSGQPVAAGTSIGNGTEQIVEAINSLKSVSTHSYYVSNFDPNIHDVDSWFDEVDRARLINRWDDRECLARIGRCLKGDAKSWLDDWVTSDRSWSNFKKDFKCLCVKKIDVANILYEVMSTDSNSFTTYAEYARKSLLRLRIVKGLSDDLITAIVLRGITDPHVKATATNASLSPNDLVNYLSTFVKPQAETRRSVTTGSNYKNKPNKRQFLTPSTNIKCYLCGKPGHKQVNCFKKSKTETSADACVPEPNKPPAKVDSAITCSYCKKPGHHIKNCFAKQRSDSNKSKVNFCSGVNTSRRNDVVVGVIDGIPVDILIDSGAIGVSLISSSVVNHLSCSRKPISRQIKGVGESITYVDSFVSLVVELEDISLDIDFLVVPSESMNSPVIIGTDVLNRDGVTYVRTKDSQRILREPNASKVSALRVSEQQRPIKTSVTGDKLVELIKVLDQFSDHIISGTATSTVTTGTMHIRLTSDTPVCYRPYKMSHDEKLRVRSIVQDLLSKGIIRESESPYSSPVLLVKKKDGSDRMCVDFRALNRITIKDRYPLPLIDDHIDRLGKSIFFSALDMASGFHQIKLDEESIPLTGFVTPEGHYEYVKMPYGLANAPIIYQRIISKTLQKQISEGRVLVYIDDCLILSSSIQEGLETLHEVLKTLTEAGFSLNLKKCSFLCTEIEYLGRVIANGEVRPSASKVQALVNSTAPRNVKQVRQFLGLAGYFRKYIPNYSTKTACIARLICKSAEFHWGTDQEKIRQEIIKILTNEPVLAIFDQELPTEVHTDASSLGYGAILQQVHKDGNRRVVAYYSQVTKGAESKYHSYELETLAVVKALQHFRHYLIGIQFQVVTDCNALKATQNKRDLIPRVARWWIYLQDFNFNIIYRKGTMMPHADYLSRNPCLVNQIEKPRNWAQIAQAGDEETQTMMRSLDQGQLDPTRYVKHNDILYYRYKPIGEEPRLLCYIPKGHRLSLLRIFHDEHGHIGVDKVVDLILRHFWFPGLRAFVRKYVTHCLICISHKRVPRAPLQPIKSWDKPDVPFDTLHVDVLGPLPVSKGSKFIMLVVDAFTKYCLLVPIVRQDVDELKRVFKYVLSLFGTPKLVISDRGRMFESAGFTSWMRSLGVQLHYITPEMHQANGQVERYIRTVLNMLRISTNYKKTEWADELWQMQLILNLTKQKTTQSSALNLLIGHEGATPAIRALVRDVAANPTPNRESRREVLRQRTAERLAQNQLQQDAAVNKDRRPPRVFQKDDLVFVIKYTQSQGKLDSGMRGPYRVVGVLQNHRYELKLLTGAYGKTTYAAAQFMVPWKGEWTPETCAAFFAGGCATLHLCIHVFRR